MVSFDPTDPGFLADPYPAFATLREQAEVHWNPALGMPVAVSHAACSQVLRERGLGRRFTDAHPPVEFRAFNMLHHNSMLENEAPLHQRLRKPVAAAFGRGHVLRLRPWIESLAERLVGELRTAIAEQGSADLVEYVAAPLPIAVIGALLGIPDSEQSTLRPWSNAIVKMYEYGLTAEQRSAAETAAREFADYLRELIIFRRGNQGTDLFSDLVGAGELTTDELIGTGALLLMAGHEASVNLVSGGVHTLLRHRTQWERLVAGAELDLAVDELIRFDSPLQCFERTAEVDTVIGDYSLPAGERIAALLGAAAHDPAIFVDPSTVDIARSPNPHLGFGAGTHYCLGAPLARIEAAAALRALTLTLPTLDLAGEPLRRKEFVIRGWSTMPVTE